VVSNLCIAVLDVYGGALAIRSGSPQEHPGGGTQSVRSGGFLELRRCSTGLEAGALVAWLSRLDDGPPCEGGRER